MTPSPLSVSGTADPLHTQRFWYREPPSHSAFLVPRTPSTLSVSGTADPLHTQRFWYRGPLPTQRFWYREPLPTQTFWYSEPLPTHPFWYSEPLRRIISYILIKRNTYWLKYVDRMSSYFVMFSPVWKQRMLFKKLNTTAMQHQTRTCSSDWRRIVCWKKYVFTPLV
jgi:hypothetical protein